MLRSPGFQSAVLFCGIQLHSLLAQSFGLCGDKKKKNPASLHILCLAPWMIEVAYRLHKRLSLQARRQQRTIVRLLSTTSGPRPVPGTWPGPNNMAYLNEQKGSGIVIAKSERAKEERGWEPVRA